LGGAGLSSLLRLRGFEIETSPGGIVFDVHLVKPVVPADMLRALTTMETKKHGR
jgi:hypothetical protein